MTTSLINTKFFLLLSFMLSCMAAYATPPLPADSDLKVEVEYVGQVPNNTLSAIPNMASPVAHKKDLLFIDQQGAIFKWTKKENEVIKIFDVSQAPSELTFINNVPVSEAILNVVGGRSKNTLYVMFSSTTLPSALNAGPYKTNICSLPTDGTQRVCDLPELIETHPGLTGVGGTNTFDMYRMGTVQTSLPIPTLAIVNMYNQYQVLYEFKYDGKSLSEPRAIVALETQGGTPTHRGGGMVLTKQGKILFSTGDALCFGIQGRHLPQNDASHVGKILLIDPKTGAMQVVAKGQRNVQRMQLVTTGKKKKQYLAWTTIGGWVAEEFNSIRLKDLLDTSVIENFGWGCDQAESQGSVQCDPNAITREGTFYVGLGDPLTLFTPPLIGPAPNPEPGYVQPHSQYGRLAGFNFAAITGPVISKKSLQAITALYGDLPSGSILATTAPLLSKGAVTFKVKLFDEYGNQLPNNSLNDLFGGNRVDPRFFLFPDGTAGVLLENNGNFYRLKEIN